MLKQLLLGCALSIPLMQKALACAFHGYTPKPTLIDKVFASEQVVLARIDPADPARFEPVEALAGSLEYVEIPARPDAQTRSQLQAVPGGAVLFARDGAYGPWVALAVVDPGYRTVVETALTRQDRWQGQIAPDRFRFFAGLLSSANPELRRLALLELDRADYAQLRKLRLKGSGALAQGIESGDANLRPIRILLAGLSRDRSLAPVLEQGLAEGAERNLRYLGAYATALVELQGASAVEMLLTRYVARADLREETREKVIEALAIQGAFGTGATRRAVRRGLPGVLAAHPELAGAVARQFGRHGNWDMGEAVAEVKRDHPKVSLRDSFAINQYIAFAREGG
ncbi:MAG: hypothetical protein AAF744_11360 [Pseudomonadota bacterium]